MRLGGPSPDRGTVTLVGLGCCVMLLTFGGVAVDLWRVIGARRELAAVAEAAALGGADAIDEALLRRSGVVGLDPEAAIHRAHRVVVVQGPELILTEPPVVSVRDHVVTVRLTSAVELGVVRFLLGPGEIEVAVTRSARPLAAD